MSIFTWASRSLTYWKYTDEASNMVSDEDIMENNYMFVILSSLSIISHLIFPQCCFLIPGTPGWLSGECVGVMSSIQVEATFLSGVFSPLTSAEACGFGKKSCVSTGVRKPGNTYTHHRPP